MARTLKVTARMPRLHPNFNTRKYSVCIPVMVSDTKQGHLCLSPEMAEELAAQLRDLAAEARRTPVEGVA